MSDAMSALKERECDYEEFIQCNSTTELKNYLIEGLPKEIEKKYSRYNNCYLKEVIFNVILMRDDKIIKLRNDVLLAKDTLAYEIKVLKQELNYKN